MRIEDSGNRNSRITTVAPGIDGQSSAGHHSEGCRPAEVQRQGVNLKTGLVVHMGYSRQWLVNLLRGVGYLEEADEALRVLPDDIDLKQLQEFGARHGISRETLTDRMGGSP